MTLPGVPLATPLQAGFAGLVALGLAFAMPMPGTAMLPSILLAALGGLAALSAPRWLGAAGGGWALAGRALLALLVLASLSFALLLPANQPSDFGIYWRCGAAVGTPLREWLELCQSVYLRPSSVFWRRSLFYTAPILGLGGDYAVLRAANALLLALTLWLLHRAARGEGGERFALIALLAAALFPEFWFALPLATSDHVALPCIVLALLAMARMQRAMPPWWLGLALGALIFLADQARSIGPLLMLTLMLLLILGRGRFLARLPVVALALATQTLLGAGLQSLLAGLPVNPGSTLQFLAARDLARPNDFASIFQFITHVWPVTPPDLQQQLGITRILAEFLGSAGLVFGYLAERLAASFNGAGYYFFATNGLPANPDSAATAEPVLGWSPWMQSHLGVVMRPALGAAAIGALLATERPLLRAALAWVGVYVLVVIGLGEVQPRYITLIWPAVAMLAAAPFLPRPAGLRQAVPALGGAVAVLATLGLYAALAPLARPSMGWSFTAASAAATPQCPAARLDIANRSVTLHLPPEAPCAVLRLPVPSGWREAGFAVSRGELVWLFQQPEPFPLTHRFGAEGPALGLERQVAAWHAVPLPPDGTDLLVRLDRVAPGAAAWVIHLPIRLPTP